MYYVLHYEIPQDESGGYLDVDDGVDFDGFESWSLGRRWDADLPSPIEIEVEPIDDYTGPPADMYDGNICLMSDAMVRALKDAGVDNIDVYPAVLKNIETGETYSYQAVNIVGLVSAADLGRSEWESYDGDGLFDVNFSRLEVDTAAAKGALIFRLAENTGTILIHEKVRERLEKQDFPSLRFLAPGDWVT
jgi:hypothetical protein